MKAGHLLRKRVVLPVVVVMALLLVGLPTARLMAQEERGRMGSTNASVLPEPMPDATSRLGAGPALASSASC